MTFEWKPPPGWEKTASLATQPDINAPKQDAPKPESYPRRVISTLPKAGVKALTEIPIGAVETKILNAINKTPVTTAQALKRSAGSSSGYVLSAVTAPLFYDGLQEYQSDDPAERKRGASKLIASSLISNTIKGATAGTAHGIAMKEMIPLRLVTGAPSLMGALAAAKNNKTSNPDESRAKKYLRGGLYGAAAGAVKGTIGGAWLGRHQMKLNPAGYKRGILAGAASASAGGFLGGAVLSAMLDYIKNRKQTSTPAPKVAKTAAADEEAPGSPDVPEEGLLPTVEIRPHQERLIQKIVNNGGVAVAAHGVGTGKCLRGDTPVWTSDGVVQVRDLFPEEWDGTEAWFPAPAGLEVLSITEEGAVVATAPDLLYAQRLPADEGTLRFTTRRGLTFEVTKQHPLPTLKEGQVVWVPAHQWGPNDCLVTPRAAVGPLRPVPVNEDLLVLLAWQITEGCDGDGSQVCITQNDPSVLAQLAERYARLAPGRAAAVVTPVGHCPYVRLGFVGAYKELARSVGYTYGLRSAQKRLPPAFLNLPERQTALLLRVLFEAEGSVSTNPHSVEFPSASELLCRQVQQLLAYLGVRSTLRSKMGCATNGRRIKRKYWRVSLYGNDVRVFAEKVGFLSERKNAALLPVEPPQHAWTTYGAPVGDLLSLLEQRGLGYAVRGTSKGRSRSVSPGALLKVAERLRRPPAAIGRSGAAARWQERTKQSLAQFGGWAEAVAARLEWLASGVVAFDSVASIEEGERGGVVYDLSVPIHHNFVAGYGGLLLHNTFASIAAFDRLRRYEMAHKVVVVTPAGLKKNYLDSVKKFSTFSTQSIDPKGSKTGVYLDNIDPSKTVTAVSYDMFRTAPEEIMKATGADMLILDEYHKVRDPTGSTYRAAVVARQYAPNFLGLTGSIVNNDPSEVVSLANLAAGHVIMRPSQFNARYKYPVAVNKGFFGGKTKVTELRHIEDIKKRFGRYVDFLTTEDVGGDMPKKEVEEIHVAMSPEQQRIYEYALKSVDPITARKIRMNLPMDYKEAAQVFTMILKARQASNSIAPFVKDITLEQAADRTPKVKRLIADTQDHLAKTPDGQVVLYSNLVNGGVDVLDAALTARGIDHALFVGKDREIAGEKVSATLRDQGVTDFLAGKKKVIVVSPAGAEGLDLRNATLFQSLDGHFNPERTRQAEARARRLGGLSQRAPEKRVVQVKRYYSVYPKPGVWGRFWGRKAPTTTDEWINTVALQKHKLNTQLVSAFKQPVAAGTNIKPADVPKKPSKYIRRWKDAKGEWRYDYPD